ATDDGRLALAEAENLLRIGAFDPATLLRLWTVDTPQAIFPARKISRLAAGWEASFLVLAANPLEDFRAVRRIATAVKQGHVLKIDRRKPSAADALAPIAMRDGIPAAIAEYDRMRAAGSSDYDVSETALNALGYAMLRHGAVTKAIEVFRANVARFPESSNVYDSLAEAYMANGDKALAIENYETSLKLNPKNKNAEEMLRKLRASP
ncbi:MAG TPA: tetratricopeptide repeat protein, partial [Thermoanaerobaculia bacterium]|nr:tetratricopeptide repeat protein [Thermoanaerobaculia bacterium]